MAAKRFPLDDDTALKKLARVLLHGKKDLQAGGPDLDWNHLVNQGGSPAVGSDLGREPTIGPRRCRLGGGLKAEMRPPSSAFGTQVISGEPSRTIRLRRWRIWGPSLCTNQLH